MEKQIKPNKTAFIVTRIFYKILIILTVFIVFFFVINFLFPANIGYASVFLFIVFALLSMVVYILELIVYKKLVYIFYDNKIIQKGGSLFTNYETELNIKNITHVKSRLPFLENKMFKTGHIDIESAGSSASEIHLCSLIEHGEIHSLLLDTMQKNGFNLDKGELVTVEKPNGLGVFFEVFKSFVIGLLVIFYMGGDILFNDEGGKNGFVNDALFKNIIYLAIFIVAILFIVHIFKFLDLRKRVYKIYKNVITYREGFLSKNYSILPFENLTDSGITQTLVDKIFGLYDVKISCQGSSHEILFKNMSNGQDMNNKLSALINEKKEDHKEKVVQAHVSGGEVVQKQKAEERVNYNNEYTKEFKIDYNRTVKLMLIVAGVAVGLLVICSLFVFSLFSSLSASLSSVLSGAFFFMLIPILALFVILTLVNAVFVYIKYKSTKFSVNGKSISYKYHFLSTKEIEFSADKVTGVVISRNFIDEWFNTISISFWSIGASSSLVFSHIKKEDGVIENIISKFGIKKEDEILNINPRFSLSDYLKSILPGFLFGLFLLLIAVVYFSFLNVFLSLGLIILVIIIFSLIYLYNNECYKRSKLTFCNNFVYCQKGWLFKKFYYSKYKDIKDITTTRYPFSSEGRIKFNVAGERIESNYGFSTGGVTLSRGKTIKSNGFTMDYVQKIKEKDELVDYIFYKRPNREEFSKIESNNEYKEIGKPVITIKPSLKNTIAPLLLVLIPINLICLFPVLMMPFGFSFFVILFLVILNALILLGPCLPIKMTTYILDGYRVLSKSGVIFKKQTSIIYDKVDFINNNQGFLNKVFKNGNVAVNTVGSSRVELKIKNIPNYLEFYKNLKEKYEND